MFPSRELHTVTDAKRQFLIEPAKAKVQLVGPAHQYLAASLILLASVVLAKSAVAQELTRPAPFKKGLKEMGFMTGYAQSLSSNRTDISLITNSPRYGVFLSPRLAGQINAVVVTSHKPHGRSGIGGLGLLQYHFKTDGRVRPYVQAGAGVLWTNLRLKEVSAHFNFHTLSGAGTNYFIRPDMALTLEGNFYHISNGRRKNTNIGVNAAMLSLGVSRYF